MERFSGQRLCLLTSLYVPEGLLEPVRTTLRPPTTTSSAQVQRGNSTGRRRPAGFRRRHGPSAPGVWLNLSKLPSVRPLGVYPGAHGNRAPGALGYGLRGYEEDDIIRGDAYPEALRVFGVLVAGVVLGIVLCVMRQRSRRKLRLKLIRGTGREEAPDWISQPLVKTLRDDRYHWVRDNMGPNISVVSSRCLRFGFSLKEGSHHEAVLCDAGFTRGRHMYAIMWPRDQRHNADAYLSIGIGYTTLDLRNESYQPIVGGNRKSLGFCVTHNYLVFNNDVILRPYPRDRPPGYSCPTLIYMYLDLDDALLSFGSDDEYWGVAFNFGNFKRNLKRPFHFMVGARGMVGKFMLFYKGRDVDSLHNAAPDLALPLEPQTSERRADPEDATTEATPAECTQFPHKASDAVASPTSNISIQVDDIMLYPKEQADLPGEVLGTQGKTDAS